MGLRKAASRAEPLLVDLSELGDSTRRVRQQAEAQAKWFETGQRKRPKRFVTRPRRLVLTKAMPPVWRRDVQKEYDRRKPLDPMNCRL